MKPTDYRIIPVVVIDSAEHAETLAEGLSAGGIPVAEITFRTPAAAAAIRRLSAHPDLLVGAGTVLTAEQVDQAQAAGARFIVSPGLSVPVVRRAQEHGLPVFPGAVTPTEVMAALDLGLDVVKFFPAGVHGGPAAIAALGGPFGQVRFVPTGGVSPANLADYLRLPNVAAVGGSWMVPSDALAAGDTDRIARLCADAVAAAAAAAA